MPVDVCRLPLVAVVLVLLVSAPRLVCAYHIGDEVPMKFRTSVGNTASQWNDVRRAMLPLFGVDRTVSLAPSQLAGLATSEIKLMVCFAGNRFTSPWVLVADAGGVRVDFITVQFTHADGRIVAARTRPEYRPRESPGAHAANASTPHKVLLVYEWDEASDSSPSSALTVVFVAGFLGSLAAMLAFSRDVAASPALAKLVL